jgi:hypothetical protein
MQTLDAIRLITVSIWRRINPKPSPCPSLARAKARKGGGKILGHITPGGGSWDEPYPGLISATPMGPS